MEASNSAPGAIRVSIQRKIVLNIIGLLRLPRRNCAAQQFEAEIVRCGTPFKGWPAPLWPIRVCSWQKCCAAVGAAVIVRSPPPA